MRIALVWNADARLVDISVRHELFVRGFEALGHEVITVCTARTAEGYAYPVHLVEGPAALAETALWQGFHFEVAVLITWHMMPDVLAAIRATGTRTIALADSDGAVSMRVHPRATWRGMVAQQPRWDLKLRATKRWFQLLMLHGRREDHEKVESTRHSDALVFGTERARENFRAILAHYGADDLGDRLCVVPYPVNEVFCETPIATDRRNRIVAIARWDAPQKDTGLMAAALRLFCVRGPRTEVVLIGRGGEAWFGELTRCYPQVRYLGAQAPEAIAALLAESRSIVFSSRWESGPIAAWEMLAVGGTVIGPPCPNFLSLAADERFGRVSPTRCPRDLAEAMRREMAAWDAGTRDPQAIAGHWRARVHPAAVCAGLLDSLSDRPAPSTGASGCDVTPDPTTIPM
jgi:glycosyltransferase involved in cell wall biosynthesis